MLSCKTNFDNGINRRLKYWISHKDRLNKFNLYFSYTNTKILNHVGNSTVNPNYLGYRVADFFFLVTVNSILPYSLSHSQSSRVLQFSQKRSLAERISFPAVAIYYFICITSTSHSFSNILQ